MLKDISYLLISSVLILVVLGPAPAQKRSKDPGHKQDAEIAGVKFSVPNGFNLEPSVDVAISFMRHEKYHLALFVAVPNAQIDKVYLTALSNSLVSQFLPQEKSFDWKWWPYTSSDKMSKYQIGRGNTTGFNNKRFVMTDYFIIQTQGREVIVGYIALIAPRKNAEFAENLFNLKKVGARSEPGWHGEAHVMASITGETYEEITSDTFVDGLTIRKKS